MIHRQIKQRLEPSIKYSIESILASPEQIRDMVLLSDNNPFDQPFTDNKFATEEFSGNILDSIVFATQFIQNHSVNGFKKEATQRVDYFSYPIRSVTKGIVNAVAHRNYFMKRIFLQLSPSAEMKLSVLFLNIVVTWNLKFMCNFNKRFKFIKINSFVFQLALLM